MVVVDTFEWRGQGRRPGMYFALGVGMAAVYLGLKLQLNALVPALAAIYVALVLLRLITTPTRGFRLTGDRLTWFTGMRRHSVTFDRIVGVSIGPDVDGQTICVVSMRDGSTVALPGVETVAPDKLMREFGVRGIRITA